MRVCVVVVVRGGGDGGIFFRSSLAVIESAVAGWGWRVEGDQNVSTLQKFTAECSLSTLNGRITMTVCSKKSNATMGYSLKSNMTVFGLGKDKLLGVFLQEVLFFSYTEGYGMSGCKCGLLFFFFF